MLELKKLELHWTLTFYISNHTAMMIVHFFSIYGSIPGKLSKY